MTVTVACRDAHSDELPTTAARLLKAALAAGWTGRATYARATVVTIKSRRFAAGDVVERDGVVGTIIDAHRTKGSPKVLGLSVSVDGSRHLVRWDPSEARHFGEVEREIQPIESVAVRLRRWPLAAVAVWHNGSFALAYVWSAVSGPRRVGARAVTALVKAAA